MLLSFFIYLVELNFIEYFKIGNLYPNLFIILSVFISLHYKRNKEIFLSNAVIGTFQDSIEIEFSGTFCIIYAIINTGLISILRKEVNIEEENFVIIIIITILFYISDEFIYSIIAKSLYHIDLSLLNICLQAFYTSLLSPIVIKVINFIIKD